MAHDMHTDEGAIATLRERYATHSGLPSILMLYIIAREKDAIPPIQALKKTLLGVLDIHQGGKGDPAAAIRRSLGREPVGLEEGVEDPSHIPEPLDAATIAKLNALTADAQEPRPFMEPPRPFGRYMEENPYDLFPLSNYSKLKL